MSNHPLNQILRFLLEVLAVSSFAFWGWAWGGWLRWPLAIGCLLVASIIWGVFRTPGDPSGGGGLVATPGRARLALELAFFALAILALFNAHSNSRAEVLAIVLGVGVVIHYALSWDRVRWTNGRMRAIGDSP